MLIAHFQNLAKKYGDTVALRGVTFDVHGGVHKSRAKQRSGALARISLRATEGHHEN